MTRRGLAAGAIACVFFLGACGDAEPQTFEDFESFTSAASAAGLSCVESKSGAELVSEIAICGDSGVTLYFFDSAKHLDDWSKVGTRLGPAVIGPNWAASGETDALEHLADELHGKLTTPE